MVNIASLLFVSFCANLITSLTILPVLSLFWVWFIAYFFSSIFSSIYFTPSNAVSLQYTLKLFYFSILIFIDSLLHALIFFVYSVFFIDSISSCSCHYSAFYWYNIIFLFFVTLLCDTYNFFVHSASKLLVVTTNFTLMILPARIWLRFSCAPLSFF